MNRLIPTALLARDRIARRAARELREGDFDRAGIDVPTLIGNLILPGIEIVLQSDGDVLGIGPYASAAELDADLVAAGKGTAAPRPGTAVFSSVESLKMIHGGHIDLAIVGATQVGERGELASWMVPGETVHGRGAAADMVARARRLVVVMEHAAADGTARILRECSLPLAGKAVVHRIVTELAVIDVTPDGLVLREVAPGVSAREVQQVTEPTLKVSPDLSTMLV